MPAGRSDPLTTKLMTTSPKTTDRPEPFDAGEAIREIQERLHHARQNLAAAHQRLDVELAAALVQLELLKRTIVRGAGDRRKPRSRPRRKTRTR